MKRRILALICSLFMLICCSMVSISVSAESAVETTTEVSDNVHETDSSPSRGVKIAGFLVIFTVAMGATAFIVARPKFKKLKEAKNNKD